MTGGKPKSNKVDIIQIKDEYYIRASSSLADNRVQVLKHAELFAVFNRFGDIQPLGLTRWIGMPVVFDGTSAGRPQSPQSGMAILESSLGIWLCVASSRLARAIGSLL